MLEEEVLHDEVVAVGVDAEVGLEGGAVVEHGGEDAVDVRKAGDAVDDVIWSDIIEPGTSINGRISGLGRREEGEIAGDKAF